MIASISRVLYIGMTSNLHKRVWQHKNGVLEGFTKQYKCHRLVWYESYDDVANAIDREKQLKRWNRVKKEWLIAQKNPTWEDLASEWYPEHQLRVGLMNLRDIPKPVIPSGANRSRSERSGVEGPAGCLQRQKSRSLHARIDQRS